MKTFARILFLFLIASSRLSAQSIVVEGVVTDWSNSPLPGVTVQISRDGRGFAGSWAYVGDVVTDASGQYHFKIPIGDPLVVYYSRSTYHASEVKRLSGTHNAIIGVVLRSASDKLAQNEAREQILTLEGMIAASKFAPPEKAKKIITEVRASMSNLDVPKELTQRVSEAWAALSPRPNPGSVNEPADPGVEAPAKTGFWEIDDGPPNF